MEQAREREARERGIAGKRGEEEKGEGEAKTLKLTTRGREVQNLNSNTHNTQHIHFFFTVTFYITQYACTYVVLDIM